MTAAAVTGWSVPLDIPIRIGRDEAQRRAVEELGKAKYGGTPAWLDGLANRLDAFLQRIFDLVLPFLLGRRAGDGGVNWGFVLAVTLLLVAIAVVVWRIGIPRWQKRQRSAALDLDPSRGAADYRALAEDHARRQNWAAAVRDRFRAVVRELELRTILDERPARTASEAAYHASRALPSCAEPLRSGAETFNAVSYGDRQADAASYDQLVRLDQQVTAAADAIDLALDSEATGVPR